MAYTTGSGRHRRGASPVWLLIAGGLGAIGLALVMMLPLVVLKAQPPAAISAPHRPSTSPSASPSASPTNPKPALPPAVPVCFQHPTGTQFFANLPRRFKEGPDSFGPTLDLLGLKPTDHPTALQNRIATNRFLARDCPDWQKANADLATLHQRYVPLPGTHRAQVLGNILEAAYWNNARLWYGKLPTSWWTYGMISHPTDPGRPPTLYAARYTHKASWFLIVPLKGGGHVYFRLECGGQGVFNKAHLDPHIYILPSPQLP